jgi:hypothetical protein
LVAVLTTLSGQPRTAVPGLSPIHCWKCEPTGGETLDGVIALDR